MIRVEYPFLSRLVGTLRKNMHKTNETRRWANPSFVLPLLVLLVSLFVTDRLWRNVRESGDKIFRTDFEFRVRDMNMRIEERMKTYEQVLRGTAGLFAADDNVSRETFARYVSTLNLEENYPGIQGIGFSLLIPKEKKQEHISSIRKQGFPDYVIRPDTEREVYTSIIYLEPFFGSNLRAFGYDMYSEPVRRTAMETARDMGRPEVSGKVTLVQESEQNAQAGFLVYLPVYYGGAPDNTIGERRKNIRGWVYAPFRMNDLMAGINNHGPEHDIDIEIYDGAKLSQDARLYVSGPDIFAESASSLYTSYSAIKLGQRTWTIAARATPLLEQRMDRKRHLLVLQGGIGISILLTLLTWLFLDDRAQAIRVARQALELALFDPLTGLPNRKLVAERLQQALVAARRHKTRAAVMFVDLDKFKPVNDNFGHAIGDLLLQAVAERLQGCVRNSDTVSRLGGDEFVVLLAEVEGPDGAAAVAEKIRQALAREFTVAGHNLRISSSIGIAIFPEHGNDEQTLLRNADTAMYHAKKIGRNNFKTFQSGMHAES